MKTIRASKIEFDSARQLIETDEALVVSAVLDREGILKYCQGLSYRPAIELEAAKFTLDGAWIVAYRHTETAYITNRADIRGRVRNVAWNSEIHALTGELHFFKALCDEVLLNRVRNGTLNKDTSSAYFCDEIPVPGEFAGQHYDFRQENVMFHHVAVGIPEGRCPSPYCGIMDSFDGFLRINVRPAGMFSCRMVTILLSEKAGIYGLAGKLRNGEKGTFVQDFMFDISKGWTQETAQAWIKDHKDCVDSADAHTSTDDCAEPFRLDPFEVLADSRRLLNSR